MNTPPPPKPPPPPPPPPRAALPGFLKLRYPLMLIALAVAGFLLGLGLCGGSIRIPGSPPQMFSSLGLNCIVGSVGLFVFGIVWLVVASLVPIFWKR